MNCNLLISFIITTFALWSKVMNKEHCIIENRKILRMDFGISAGIEDDCAKIIFENETKIPKYQLN